MQRYDCSTWEETPGTWSTMIEASDGVWVLYEAASARIASLEAELVQSRDVACDYVILCSKLEAQLAAMTDERDSESRWAKHYSDKVTELEAQLAAAQKRERVYRDVDALLEQPLEADHA